MREGSVKKDPNRGTWTVQVDVGFVGGKRRQVKRRGFRTKAEALEVIREIEDQARSRSGWIAADRTTLGGYLERWSERLPATGLEPSTVANSRALLAAYVTNHRVAGVPLQAVTALDLDELYGQLMGTGRSARTTRLVHTVLRRALADAEAKRLIPTNPAAAATPPRPSAARRKVLTVWTPPQLRAVLDKLRSDDGGHAAIALMANTGLRRGEVIGLRWRDVDLEAARLVVRRSVVAVDGRPHVKESTKTDASARTVDLGPATVAGLKRWRTAQREARLLMGPGWQGSDDTVFTQATGSMLDLRSLGRRLTTVAKRAKVPTIHVHDLRHTHATHLLAAGVNPKIVSERLGHTSVAFTLDTYGHVMPTQQAGAAEAAEALLG